MSHSELKLSGGRLQKYAIIDPSGDHPGVRQSLAVLINWCRLLPSLFTRNSCLYARASHPTNTSCIPSGDQLGHKSAPDVSWTSWDPSDAMTTIPKGPFGISL